MLNTDVNQEFNSIGKKATLLAILEIIFLVSYVFILIIGLLAMFIIILLQTIIIILRIKIANLIKKANEIFMHNRLTQCHNKLISATLLFYLGTLFFLIGFSSIIISRDTSGIIISIISIFIGIILICISGILEYQAWDRLQIYFEKEQPSFPNSIKNAPSLIKIGGILNIFIFTIFIGSILRIIGYFMLSVLKNIKYKPIKSPQESRPTTEQISKVYSDKQVSQFCPNCGTKLVGNEKFCGACGSEL